MIRIGINVPNFGPETDPASLLGWAQYADRNGFATLLVSDHVAPTREVTDTYPAPFYDPRRGGGFVFHLCTLRSPGRVRRHPKVLLR